MFKNKSNIHIAKDLAELATILASDFQNTVKETAKMNRRFYVALSGGSTPAVLFRQLSAPKFRNQIPWQRVHFFWGDERCVPPDHEESNYGMTKKLLLNHVSIPGKNVHRIHGEADPAAEAVRYSGLIEKLVPRDKNNLPRFDWILLGMGIDGHTASIFPGADNLLVSKNTCAVAVHPVSGQKRITLTLPVINNANRISFMVAGSNKAQIVHQILSQNIDKYPAAHVQPTVGILEWFLDRSAAKLL